MVSCPDTQLSDKRELRAWACRNLSRWQGRTEQEIDALLQNLLDETSLDFQYEKFTRLPEALGALGRVDYLNLFDVPLQALPESIGHMQGLQTLLISPAHFETLPASFTGLAGLAYCRINARLGALPDDFGALENLVALDLSDNALTCLPESMRRLTRLKALCINNNRLESLPDWLADLPELKTLQVCKNPLTEVPARLGECPALESLQCDPHVVSPDLHRWRVMRAGPLGEIQVTFSKKLAAMGFELPPEDVQHRRRGRISLSADGEDYGRGDTVNYLFGRDERGEYLDYFIGHRIWGDNHIRIREDGSTESLEALSVFAPTNSRDPAKKARYEALDRARRERISAMLAAKGFLPFSTS